MIVGANVVYDSKILTPDERKGIITLSINVGNTSNEDLYDVLKREIKEMLCKYEKVRLEGISLYSGDCFASSEIELRGNSFFIERFISGEKDLEIAKIDDEIKRKENLVKNFRKTILAEIIFGLIIIIFNHASLNLKNFCFIVGWLLLLILFSTFQLYRDMTRCPKFREEMIK